jgi:hypothetical protein
VRTKWTTREGEEEGKKFDYAVDSTKAREVEGK